MHGEYASCIQCGYLRDGPAEDAVKPAPEVFVTGVPKARKKAGKKVRQAA